MGSPPAVPDGYVLQHLQGAAAAAFTPEVIDFTVAQHPIAQNTPGDAYHRDTFAWRMGVTDRQPGYELLIVREGQSAAGATSPIVGYLFGTILGPRTPYWSGVLHPRIPGVLNRNIEENGRRTALLAEVYLAPEHRGRGLGSLLDDTFLAGHAHHRTTLAVESTNTLALAMYEQRSFRVVGRVQDKGFDLLLMLRLGKNGDGAIPNRLHQVYTATPGRKGSSAKTQAATKTPTPTQTTSPTRPGRRRT